MNIDFGDLIALFIIVFSIYQAITGKKKKNKRKAQSGKGSASPNLFDLLSDQVNKYSDQLNPHAETESNKKRQPSESTGRKRNKTQVRENLEQLLNEGQVWEKPFENEFEESVVREEESMIDEERVPATENETSLEEQSVIYDEAVKSWEAKRSPEQGGKLQSIDAELETPLEVESTETMRKTRINTRDRKALQRAYILKEVLDSPASRRLRHPYDPIR